MTAPSFGAAVARRSEALDEETRASTHRLVRGPCHEFPAAFGPVARLAAGRTGAVVGGEPSRLDRGSADVLGTSAGP